MPTLTIRNVPESTVKSLKAQAKSKGHSMEQEVRVLLESIVDRRRVLDEIKESWKDQKRPTTAEEIERWIREGRD